MKTILLFLFFSVAAHAQMPFIQPYATDSLWFFTPFNYTNALIITYPTNSAGILYWTLPASNGFSGQVLVTDGANPATLSWATPSGGSVTSVGLALPVSVFTISGSPVTTSGTLTGAFNTQDANTVFAGPSSGSPDVPTFRVLVASDIAFDTGNYIRNLAHPFTETQTANLNISGSAGIGDSVIADHYRLRGAAGGGASFNSNGVLDDRSMSNGELLIGHGGGEPDVATLTEGYGISITNAPGSITIATTTPAFYGAATASPTGTLSSTFVMMGLAGSITPANSGNVLIVISGSIQNTTPNDGGETNIQYGTGSAPANGVPATGSTVGSTSILSIVTSGVGATTISTVPFTCNALITGLTVGTPYWIDLELNATGGFAEVSQVQVSAIELP